MDITDLTSTIIIGHETDSLVLQLSKLFSNFEVSPVYRHGSIITIITPSSNYSSPFLEKSRRNFIVLNHINGTEEYCSLPSILVFETM